jgi:DNA-directed RNA polymerase subunit RPC12/RpoP
MKRFVCRLLASHKWVRLETSSEEAYRCSRCGKRHFGKPGGRDLQSTTGFIDPGGTGGPF